MHDAGENQTQETTAAMALIAEIEPTFYDYENQAWVKAGKYVRCGHPETMDCRCYGKIHEGENYVIQSDNDRRI